MSLEVRAYNVLFGDSILISWDEADGKHHAWVDFGNFHNDPNAVFATVYEDVLRRTRGVLDLVLITHRHLDHLEGFYSLRERFRKDFRISRLWHAHVTEDADDLFELADEAVVSLLPERSVQGFGEIGRIYRNNQHLGTKDRMEEILRSLTAQSVHQVHRKMDLKAEGAAAPEMDRMKVEVLAPEKDSSVYLRPLQEAIASRSALNEYFLNAVRQAGRSTVEHHGSGSSGPLVVPNDIASMAEGSPLERLADFARLRRRLRTGGLEVLAAVDRTRNNTSIVSRWTYGRTKLLLTGDAEEASWEIMRRHGFDLSVDLVKVGHHGSINASPEWSFKRAFPRRRPSNAVLLSTEPTRFTGENEVPNEQVLDGWTSRLIGRHRLKRTDAVRRGKSVAFVFRD